MLFLDALFPKLTIRLTMLSIDEAFNEIESKQPHPLLNPDSKHYSMFDGIEAIERMEQMFDREELMAWAKISAMKYRLRIGAKDDPLKEVEKIRTYEAYYRYLDGLD